MTINDLLKQIPEEFRDSFVTIYIPKGIPEEDQGKNYPLIQVSIDQMGTKNCTIILEADTFQ